MKLSTAIRGGNTHEYKIRKNRERKMYHEKNKRKKLDLHCISRDCIGSFVPVFQICTQEERR